jgi:hypothetical protein
MKILKPALATLLFFFLVQSAFSAFVPSTTQTKEKPKHAQTMTAQEQHSFMEQFVKLTPKEYGIMRGKKLSFFEKVEFKILQKRYKKKLYDGDDSTGFNLGGFALGFLLGLIGVLLAYIFSQDRNFRKWTWIGFGVYAVIIIAILLAAGA